MSSLQEYSFEGIVGTGTFGEVKLAVTKKGQKVVIKTIDKGSVSPKLIAKEIEAGKKLHHKGLVQFLESFENDTNVFIVLDYIDGVNMFTWMNEREFASIPEKEARKMTKQLAEALAYIHSKGIVHRDLKLENIVITKKGRVKIIDFGLCDIVSDEKSCEGWVGSPDYVAPEILLRKDYSGQKADIWSLGTLLYIFLFSEIPFVREERYNQLSKSGHHPAIEWPAEPKLHVSETAKDLIKSMLREDPFIRISIKEVLSHKWFQKNSILSAFTKVPLRKITNKSAVDS
jgi:serine/threonine protein kinase